MGRMQQKYDMWNEKNIMGSDEGSLCASMWGYARRLAFEQEPEYSILLGILQDEIECTH